MNKTKVIQELSIEALESQERCLTIYHSLNSLEDVITSKEVKSICIRALEQSEIKDKKQVIKDVCKIIVHNVLRLKNTKTGLAIFFKFNPLNFNKEDMELNRHNLNIFFSTYQPETKFFFGKIFDLSTLQAMDHTDYYLFVNISFGDIKIYDYNGEEIKLILTLENHINEKMEDRFTYSQKTALTIGSGGVLTSSGYMQEKKAKFTRKIVNDAIDAIKNISNDPGLYSRVIVIYSPDFSVENQHLIENLKHLSQKEMIVKQENIDNDVNLSQRVKGIIRNQDEEEITHEIIESKTRIDRVLKQELQEVVEYLRNGNAHKMYLKEGITIKGFILNNDLPFIENYDGTERVLDIVPWIVKKAIEIDASLNLLDKEDPRIDQDIALIPRY